MRFDGLKALSTEIHDALRAVERRHVKLEEAATMADAALRDQLLMQSTTAASELAKLGDRLSADLSRSHQELSTAKTDRAALATLLNEMATRLTGGPGPAAPGKNGPRG